MRFRDDPLLVRVGEAEWPTPADRGRRPRAAWWPALWATAIVPFGLVVRRVLSDRSRPRATVDGHPQLKPTVYWPAGSASRPRVPARSRLDGD